MLFVLWSQPAADVSLSYTQITDGVRVQVEGLVPLGDLNLLETKFTDTGRTTLQQGFLGLRDCQVDHTSRGGRSGNEIDQQSFSRPRVGSRLWKELQPLASDCRYCG